MHAPKRKRIIAGLAALGLTASLAACSGGNPLGGDDGDESLGSITIGSQGFAESDILAQLYGQALAAGGYTVDYAPGIGSRETFIPALQDGSIDLIPDYAGNLLYGADPDATATSTADVMAALPAPSNRSASWSRRPRRPRTPTRSSSRRSSPRPTTS